MHRLSFSFSQLITWKEIQDIKSSKPISVFDFIRFHFIDGLSSGRIAVNICYGRHHPQNWMMYGVNGAESKIELIRLGKRFVV